MLRYLTRDIHGSKQTYGMKGDKVQVLYFHGETVIACNSGEHIPVALVDLVDIPVDTEPLKSAPVNKERPLSAKAQKELNMARAMGVKID